MTDAPIEPEFYLISPPELDLAAFALQLAACLDAGPVSCFQLRLPDADPAQLRQAAETLAPICWERDIAFLICDDIELARALDLDGVHLEQDPTEARVREARKILGDDKSIGASCKTSRHLAMELGEAGADYVSFGPVFMSPTKDLPPMTDAIETIRWWTAMMELPCVAIGGLAPVNADQAVAAGADFIAAIGSVWSGEESPEAAIAAFGTVLKGS